MKIHLVAALSIASPVFSQSLNVDIGMNLGALAGVPSSSYAAAGQPGDWNAFLPTLSATPLSGLDGNPTGVTLRSDATSAFNVFPGVITPGDDQRLMEDFHLTPNLNTPSTWTLEGLEDGDYILFTYASDPSLIGLQTEIRVTGSNDPPQFVGDGWPGAHGLGQTYARHTVTVSGGTLEFQAVPVGGALETGVLNGFQLVQNGGTFLGTNYCSANPNSTGQSAQMRGFGSASVGANNVELACTDMPTNSFGFFLVSRTRGLVTNPGGSAGNLCLGSPIGRFVGPGEVQNSGAAGEIRLTLDLARIPTPTGFVAVMPTESWAFSTWFRDTGATGPTSNFSDGYEIVFQ